MPEELTPEEIDKIAHEITGELYPSSTDKMLVKAGYDYALFKFPANESETVENYKKELTLIDDNEKLACSLISKYPYNDVSDVILEACKHQRDHDRESYKPFDRETAREIIDILQELIELSEKVNEPAIKVKMMNVLQSLKSRYLPPTEEKR